MHTNADHDCRAIIVVIGIATCGRSEILLDTLTQIYRQTQLPDRIIVAYVENSDIGNGVERFPEVEFIQATRGSCAQRNVIIHMARTSDLLVFIDDDFYLEPTYILATVSTFIKDTTIVAATGTLLADGINGPGIKGKDAELILSSVSISNAPAATKPIFNAYGCNMTFRTATITQNSLLFDEKLPLYGWFEDVDFCRQIAQYGRIVRISNAYGVHLGAKVGRTTGVRLGYSQVANPIYLARKGTLSWHDAILRIVTRLLKNALRSIVSEQYIDRRGRLRGNLSALFALTTGSLDPGRIRELS